MREFDVGDLVRVHNEGLKSLHGKIGQINWAPPYRPGKRTFRVEIESAIMFIEQDSLRPVVDMEEPNLAFRLRRLD